MKQFAVVQHGVIADQVRTSAAVWSGVASDKVGSINLLIIPMLTAANLSQIVKADTKK